jgi:hypothetical protein
MLMRCAGFKAVSLRHLVLDSYDLSEGKFDFQWNDSLVL